MAPYSKFVSKISSVPAFIAEKAQLAKEAQAKGLMQREAKPPTTDEEIEVVILLKRISEFPKNGAAPVLQNLLNRPQKIDYAAFKARNSADPQQIAEVLKFITFSGVKLVSSSPEKRMVVIRATKSKMAAIFNTTIEDFVDSNGTKFFACTSPISIPTEIANYVEDVIGLNNKPLTHPVSNTTLMSRGAPAAPAPSAKGAISADATSSAVTPYNGQNGYTGGQVASFYDFPEADGTGQTIGVIELGGGYSDTELDTYFAQIGSPRPQIISVGVAGASNSPDPQYDGEVNLDIQVLGSVVPNAKQVVYFCPNSHAGFIEGLQTAIQDADNKPSIISISWGLAEKYWSADNINSFEEILKDAASLGITVLASAGDQGSTDGDTGLNLQFPSSSSYVLSCGGTSITVADNKITSEEVWQTWAGSTGGGFSSIIDYPSYQTGIVPTDGINPTGKRGVPDIAGSANAWCGYYVLVDGQQTEKGGTSAVSPLWAGFFARVNQLLQKNVGYVHNILYSLTEANVFNPILTGSNGDNNQYNAGPIWNPCTGLGSPKGNDLFKQIELKINAGE